MRKLPKPLRFANLVYQIIMGTLAGINFIFATLEDIPKIYFEVVSVLTSAFPVAWTNILDACKKYVDEETPPVSPPTSEVQDDTDQ